MTENAATTPPLGKVLTVDEELALTSPALAYGNWLDALGLPDLAEKACTHLPQG